ncbi:MAG: hypothetical protein ACK4NR_06350 [Micavibrio sp.]
MSSLKAKWAIPAALLTSAALLSLTGGGDADLPQEIDPMEYAVDGQCKAGADINQKIDCLDVTDEQAQFTAKAMEERGVKLSAEVKDDCYGFVQPGNGIPNASDVLVQLNANRVTSCFNGLEKAAPAEMKAEISRIAGYSRKGLEVSGL